MARNMSFNNKLLFLSGVFRNITSTVVRLHHEAKQELFLDSEIIFDPTDIEKERLANHCVLL